MADDLDRLNEAESRIDNALRTLGEQSIPIGGRGDPADDQEYAEIRALTWLVSFPLIVLSVFAGLALLQKKPTAVSTTRKFLLRLSGRWPGKDYAFGIRGGRLGCA